MKFSLQYAKLLSQKYLNIDDDIIPEIEMCLEREGDKVSIPYDVEGFGITIEGNGDDCDYSHGYGYVYGEGGYIFDECNGYNLYGDGKGYGYNDGDGDGDGYSYGYGRSYDNLDGYTIIKSIGDVL